MPPKTPKIGPNSAYSPPPPSPPDSEGRLFDISQVETQDQISHRKIAERAANERVPETPRSWDSIRKNGNTKGRGVHREGVEDMLAQHGVTGRGTRKRLMDYYDRAVERAGGGQPEGATFYAKDQPERFETDSKHFRLPYNVIVGVNAVLSPKTALATKSGLQTNREAAHKVISHVLNGGDETNLPKGIAGLAANHVKAAKMLRQHLDSGTHPLDATDEKGRPLVSGPKVEAYYSNYMNPSRVTTDIQHSRAVFGPSVRSDLSTEELAYKQALKKSDPEAHDKVVIKTPAEQLLERPGVHEFSAHHTKAVAAKLGRAPAELQSIVWHQVKHERGEDAPGEMRPLFDSREKPTRQSTQPSLFSDRRNK